jgi:hypothetical protein
VKHILSYGDFLFEGPVSQFRDRKYFKGADVKYPDMIFQHLNDPESLQIAIRFYEKQISIYNNIFGRKFKIAEKRIVKTDEGYDMRLVFETDWGLRPEFFAYPTGKMGEHVVVDHITKDVPGISLRHELIHEAIVPFILAKFDRINHMDQSAKADSIDDVQRQRAYNYSLEDVFYERVVEHLERLPDFKDTFPVSTFIIDVNSRIEEEGGKDIRSSSEAIAVLEKIFEKDGVTNEFLMNTLRTIYEKGDYSRGLRTQEKEMGHRFEQFFNVQKDIFAKELSQKLYDFTDRYMDEYKGVLKRLKDHTP